LAKKPCEEAPTERQELVGQEIGPGVGHQPAADAGPHHVGRAPGVGGETGAGEGHRLEVHDPEALAARGQHEDVGIEVQLAQLTKHSVRMRTDAAAHVDQEGLEAVQTAQALLGSRLPLCREVIL